MRLLICATVITSVFITSCSSIKKPITSSSTTSTTSKVPRLPKKTLPGGDYDNWRYLGTTDSQVVVEINESSVVVATFPQIYSFSDRKRVIDINKFKYVDNTKYKYILASWLINCDIKQYQDISATIYDALGNKLKDINYTSNNMWLPVKSATVSQLQYNYVCLGINRNLGY